MMQPYLSWNFCFRLSLGTFSATCHCLRDRSPAGREVAHRETQRRFYLQGPCVIRSGSCTAPTMSHSCDVLKCALRGPHRCALILVYKFADPISTGFFPGLVSPTLRLSHHLQRPSQYPPFFSLHRNVSGRMASL